MILADLTERKIQECVKVGITAEVGFGGSTIDGHVNRDDCTPITTKNEGLLPLAFHTD